jgi:hypothetical protein
VVWCWGGCFVADSLSVACCSLAGNHEIGFNNLKRREIRQLLSNATYIEDQTVVVKGIRFYGSPWTSSTYARLLLNPLMSMAHLVSLRVSCRASWSCVVCVDRTGIWRSVQGDRSWGRSGRRYQTTPISS